MRTDLTDRQQKLVSHLSEMCDYAAAGKARIGAIGLNGDQFRTFLTVVRKKRKHPDLHGSLEIDAGSFRGVPIYRTSPEQAQTSHETNPLPIA